MSHFPNRSFNDDVDQKVKNVFFASRIYFHTRLFFYLYQAKKKVSCGNPYDEIRLAKIAFLTFWSTSSLKWRFGTWDILSGNCHSTKTQFEFHNMKSFPKDISSHSSMQSREKHVLKHESEMRFNRFLWKSVENTQFRNARSNPVQRNKLKTRFLQNLSALRFRIDFLKKQKKLQT